MNSSLFTLVFFISKIIQVLSATTSDSSSTESAEIIINSIIDLTTNLKNYIEQQDVKIETLRRGLNIFEKNHKIARADPANYLANPINAFLLTKRLYSDWQPIAKALEVNTTTTNIRKNLTISHPSKEYYKEIATSLNRFIDVFDLNVVDVAKGLILDRKFDYEFTVDDCYKLGRQAFDQDLHNISIAWFNQTLNRLNSNNAADEMDETIKEQKYDILGFMALSYHQQEMYSNAIEVTRKILELYSDDRTALQNIELFTENLDKNQTETNKIGKSLETTDLSIFDEYQRKRFNRLCRNEIHVNDQSDQLHCKFVSNPLNLFLLIAPIKLEEIRLEPYIVLYHDVLSNDEIEHIKSLSDGQFKIEPLNDETELVRRKSATLTANMNVIDKRIEDFTMLSTKSTKSIQIDRYSLGGYCLPHFDFILNDENSIADRIGTILFYLNDVTDSGATVFPLLDVAVNARKGSALFWFNLFVGNDPDLRMKYGICPILEENMWLATKWLYVQDQQLTKPYQSNNNGREIKNI